MKHTCTRYHDISTGHRVHGHESKCAEPHGHNYRIHFTCTPDRETLDGDTPPLDKLGRVIDFGVMKSSLCEWLEERWDHKFLVWEHDPNLPFLKDVFPRGFVGVPFNPTAENMAQYLVDVVGPEALKGTGVRLVRVVVEETAKCSAAYGEPA